MTNTSNNQEKTYYITTPIYYVNDVPHLGHVYTTLACDMLARFYRLDGYAVEFLTGTDEHGQKIQRASEKKGIPTQDFVDQVSHNFREVFDKFGITHTLYGRTSNPHHHKAAQEIWKRLQDNGFIYLGSYEGWYSIRDEAFFQADELIDGKAPTGAPVEWVVEPCYFFKLSAFQEPLLKYYEENADFVAPESRLNEVKRFVEGGLHDLCVSRTTIQWGVKVPHDTKHVMYVWLDALTIYLSALGFPDDVDGKVKKHWSRVVHVMGKDIVRFHAVYWPAFLMAANLPVPERIFAHGWWVKDGEKMSKSLGNIIDPLQIIEKYSTDALRYFLLREVPFGQDGDFAEAAFIQRLNGELANTYGNLVQRTLAFIYKNLNGVIPTPVDLSQEDQDLLNIPSSTLTDLRHLMDKQSLNRAIEKTWLALFEGNKYMDSMKPWSLKNENPQRMGTILYVLCEFIRKMAILTQPIVPDLSKQVLDQLMVSLEKRTFIDLEQSIKPGTVIPEPKPLVMKVL